MVNCAEKEQIEMGVPLNVLFAVKQRCRPNN